MRRAVGWLLIVLIVAVATWIIAGLMNGTTVDAVARIARAVAALSAVALGVLLLAHWFVQWAVRTARLTAPAARRAIRSGGMSLLRGDTEVPAKERGTDRGEHHSSGLRRVISSGGLSLITSTTWSQQDPPLSDA